MDHHNNNEHDDDHDRPAENGGEHGNVYHAETYVFAGNGGPSFLETMQSLVNRMFNGQQQPGNDQNEQGGQGGHSEDLEHQEQVHEDADMASADDPPVPDLPRLPHDPIHADMPPFEPIPSSSTNNNNNDNNINAENDNNDNTMNGDTTTNTTDDAPAPAPPRPIRPLPRPHAHFHAHTPGGVIDLFTFSIPAAPPPGPDVPPGPAPSPRGPAHDAAGPHGPEQGPIPPPAGPHELPGAQGPAPGQQGPGMAAFTFNFGPEALAGFEAIFLGGNDPGGGAGIGGIGGIGIGGMTMGGINIGAMGEMGGMFNMMFKEPEPDSKRARILVRGMDVVPEGLVRRLERAGGVPGGQGSSEGSAGCAVCWGPLLEEVERGEWDTPREKEAKEKARITAEEPRQDGAGEGNRNDENAGGNEKARDGDAAVDDASDLHGRIVALPCAHVYHAECLLPWFSRNTTCPTCRFDIDPESLTLAPPEPVTWIPRPPGDEPMGGEWLHTYPMPMPWMQPGAMPEPWIPQPPGEEPPRFMPFNVPPAFIPGGSRLHREGNHAPEDQGGDNAAANGNAPNAEQVNAARFHAFVNTILRAGVQAHAQAQGQNQGAQEPQNQSEAQQNHQQAPMQQHPEPQPQQQQAQAQPQHQQQPQPQHRGPYLPDAFFAPQFRNEPFIIVPGGNPPPHGQAGNPPPHPGNAGNITQSQQQPGQSQAQQQRQPQPQHRGPYIPGPFFAPQFRNGPFTTVPGENPLPHGQAGDPPPHPGNTGNPTNGGSQNAGPGPQWHIPPPPPPPEPFGPGFAALRAARRAVNRNRNGGGIVNGNGPQFAFHQAIMHWGGPADEDIPFPNVNPSPQQQQPHPQASQQQQRPHPPPHPPPPHHAQHQQQPPHPPNSPSRRELKKWTPPEPVGKSLRQRVEERERALGLRCDDVVCGVAPTDDDPVPLGADSDAKRKRVNMHAAYDAHGNACEHSFHPACLVMSARVAGVTGEDYESHVRGVDGCEGGKEREGEEQEDEVQMSCPACRAVGSLTRAEWEEGVRASEEEMA